jgi:hypothetical protein
MAGALLYFASTVKCRDKGLRPFFLVNSSEGPEMMERSIPSSGNGNVLSAEALKLFGQSFQIESGIYKLNPHRDELLSPSLWIFGSPFRGYPPQHDTVYLPPSH